MELKERVEFLVLRHKGLRQCARDLGIDASYLSRIMNGEKVNPGNEILNKLGLRKVITYERIRELPSLY